MVAHKKSIGVHSNMTPKYTYEQLIAMAPARYPDDEHRRDWVHEAWILLAEESPDWHHLALRRSRVNPLYLHPWREFNCDSVLSGDEFRPDFGLESAQEPAEPEEEASEDSTVTYSWYEQYLSSLHPESALIYRLHCDGWSRTEIARLVNMDYAGVTYQIDTIYRMAAVFRAVREAQHRLLEAIPSLEWSDLHKSRLRELVRIGSLARATEALQCPDHHFRDLLKLPLSQSQREDLKLIITRGTRALGLNRRVGTHRKIQQ